MSLLVEPYERSPFFVFVIHPLARRVAVIGFVSLFLVAVLRAVALKENVRAIVADGLWFVIAAFLLFPLWNRFVVYPWVKRRSRRDRIGFLAFFEVLPLCTALWVMAARVLWGPA